MKSRHLRSRDWANAFAWGRALARIWFLALVFPVAWTQSQIDRTFGQVREREVLYLWSGKHVGRLFPGLENVMADIYWLRTVQYFGSQRAFSREKRFDLLQPLVEITVELDPRFEIAYRYGAIFLSEPRPFGPGNPLAGVKLLEKGTRALPHAWFIWRDLAFVHFYFLRDARRASEILLEAWRLPGAPFWYRTLAADFLAKGGEREVSRRIWRQIYDSSEQGMRVNARTHLDVLDALDAVDRLNAAAEAFAGRTSRKPASVDELIAAGVLRGRPVDPAGIPFVYDPERGVFSVARNSPLWRPS